MRTVKLSGYGLIYGFKMSGHTKDLVSLPVKGCPGSVAQQKDLLTGQGSATRPWKGETGTVLFVPIMMSSCLPHPEFLPLCCHTGKAMLPLEGFDFAVTDALLWFLLWRF